MVWATGFSAARAIMREGRVPAQSFQSVGRPPADGVI